MDRFGGRRLSELFTCSRHEFQFHSPARSTGGTRRRLAAISRAPYAKLAEYRQYRGWTFPWYSSHGNDFNYDFHVTLDESRAPLEYNYRDKEELVRTGFTGAMLVGDFPGNSVFLRDKDEVYHAYSAYARGLDHLFTPFNFLDLTPYGRQEAWEDSPPGWPQRRTFG